MHMYGSSGPGGLMHERMYAHTYGQVILSQLCLVHSKQARQKRYNAIYCCVSFSKRQILLSSKLKGCADDEFKVNTSSYFSDREENFMGKGGNAVHTSTFPPFWIMFSFFTK